MHTSVSAELKARTPALHTQGAGYSLCKGPGRHPVQLEAPTNHVRALPPPPGSRLLKTRGPMLSGLCAEYQSFLTQAPGTYHKRLTHLKHNSHFFLPAAHRLLGRTLDGNSSVPELEVCLLPLGVASGSGRCQGPAPGPFLSSLRVTPREASVLGLHTLAPQSLGRTWLRAGRRAGHPGPRAHSQQRATPSGVRGPSPCLPWPRANMTTCPLPFPLPPPTPARPPGPTKHGLLRAVWSPLPSPRGLRVVQGSRHVHTSSFNLVTTQHGLDPGLCKPHQGTEGGCLVTRR